MIRSAALSVSCMASRKGLVGPNPSSGAGAALAEAEMLQPEVLSTLKALSRGTMWHQGFDCPMSPKINF